MTDKDQDAMLAAAEGQDSRSKSLSPPGVLQPSGLELLGQSAA